jgi:hypothetical protein
MSSGMPVATTPAEDEDQQDEHDRHRDHLAAGDVALGDLIDACSDRYGAADLRRQARRIELRADGVVLGALAAVIQRPQPDHDVGGVPIPGQQAGRSAVVIAGHARHCRQRPQPAGGRSDRVAEGWIVDRGRAARVQRQYVGILITQLAGDPLGRPRGLTTRILEAAAGQPREHTGTPADSDRDEHERRDHGKPPMRDDSAPPPGEHPQSPSVCCIAIVELVAVRCPCRSAPMSGRVMFTTVTSRISIN